MTAEPFRVPVGDGALAGHRSGTGPPALLLHGGPAWSDYTGGCAAELEDHLELHRYTQWGAPPSTAGGPYTIETHMADALAVLDHFGIERAWAVGHSWGGHLAMHLAVTHPDRLLGLVCVSTLGAFDRAFAEFDRNMQGRLTPAQEERIAAIEAARRRGEASEADLVERTGYIWPHWFADSAAAPANVATRIGVECSRETNASIAHHFRLSTLATGLPSVTLPALFVHGEDDPLPVSSSLEAAALIRGAVVETIPACGHFPWLERPGELRRIASDFLPNG